MHIKLPRFLIALAYFFTRKLIELCKNKSGTFLWPTVYIVHNIKHVLRLPLASHGVIFDTALMTT